MKQARSLRIFQIIAIAYVLFLFWLIRVLPTRSDENTMTPIKWLILAAALFCAVDGFYMQKRVLRTPRNLRVASKSTPIGRWMVGNVLRIAFATAVSLWAMMLHFQGGPDSLAIPLVALSLILLLIWKPGAVPAESQQIS
jgi:hypothetical protein